MKRAPGPPHVHGGRSARQLSPETWPDFERLFAANGGVWGGCWCMYFHKPGSFEAGAYESNRKEKRSLVERGHAHGTIVYCGGEPVGWCQFGPKEELARIDKKRGYVPSDLDPWRITCLFIAAGHRKQGFAELGVSDSINAMKKLGATTIEAYPVEGEANARFLWSGTPSLFEDAGFSPVSRLGKRTWVYALKLITC